MPKRYTDTEKWKKQWFRELSTAEKSAWFYITEQCDNVGVWDVDFSAAEFMIGEKIDWQGLIEKTNGNIEILDNGKWWLSDFCSFQYTDLSPESKSIPVISHIKLLKKHGLYERVMEMLKPLDNLTVSLDKDLKAKAKTKTKVKVKAKEKAKEKEKKEYAPGVKMQCVEYQDLCERFGKKKIDGFIEKISDWQLSKGKKFKDYPATIKNWMRKDAGVDSVKELEIPKIPKCPKCGKSWENEINNNKSHCMGCNTPLPKSRGP